MGRLQPDAYVMSLSAVSPGYFTGRGIKGLILDLDNTLIPWQSGRFEPKMIKLLKHYLDSGLKLCVVSNAFNKRVTNILDPIGIPGVARAVKPRRKAFLKALEIMGTTVEETAVVGDQLFTDIYGGNRLGLYTVLVVPISKREFLGTKFVRMVERRVLLRLAKKGVIEIPG